MAKHGVYSLPTVIADRSEGRTTKNGAELIYRILTIRYDFYASDGSSVAAVVIGEGMDSGDKASNKAMSVAEKYCLLQAFKIPTEEPKDPENESHELKPKGAAPAAPTPAPQAQPAAVKPRVYEGAPGDAKIIADVLKKRGVPESLWSEIDDKMLGRPSTDLVAVIADVTKAGAKP